MKFRRQDLAGAPPTFDPSLAVAESSVFSLMRVRLSYGVPGTSRAALELAPGPGIIPQPSSGPTNSFHLQVDFSLSTRRSVLFGPSGAGKSTLLRLLAGLLQPSAGTIVLGGTTLTGPHVAVPPGQRGIGYLNQEPALFPHLSVERNLAYGLHSLGQDARRARVAEMLTTFSLEPLARRMPLHLSGGERQRVALARTLAPDPSLLLLDEPFAALDQAMREKMMSALDQYLATRRTVVIAVSHDVAAVYASGAEVLLLEEGRLTGQGPSHQVLAPHRERLLRQLGALPDGA